MLDDVPATSLPTGSVAALTGAVRDRGAGLLVLGGAHSLTLGGYSKSALDRLLPVRSVAPGQEPRALAIVLVLDRSGSMINLAGGVPKLRMAQAAAKVAADYVAQHDDELAIVAFDTATHVVVPLQSLSDKATRSAVDRAVNNLQAAGGTNIYAGLQSGLKQAVLSHAVSTHIILMTDGVSAPANYPPLVAADARGPHHALDGGARQRLRPHAAQEPRARGRWPLRLHGGCPQAAAHLRARGAAQPRRLEGARQARGQRGRHEPAHAQPRRQQAAGADGPRATTLRSGASAPLVTHEHARTDPVLAQWQTGLGRVAVFTPGAGRGGRAT